MVKTTVLSVVLLLAVGVKQNDGSYITRERRQTTAEEKRFHLESHTMATWYEALYHCRNHKGQLATVETAEENEEVLKLIRQTGKQLNLFWISGTDEDHEGRWVWNSTGGEISGFTPWQRDQPNNLPPGQHCLGYSQYTTDNSPGSYFKAGFWWVDSDCDIRSGFICQLN